LTESVQRSIMKWATVLLLSVSTFLFVLLWLNSVDDEPTFEDIDAILSVFGDVTCADITDFQEQVTCIRGLQAILRVHFPDMRCAARNISIEPSEFAERGYGCCFDRARILEKTLKHMGYEVRRLAIFDSSSHQLLALAIPGVSSHATLEVLTSKGWMGVDSNELFVLIDKEKMNPLTYQDIPSFRDRLLYEPTPKKFYGNDLIGIYGLYSRHGLSHYPMVPGPEINWKQFFKYNLSF
jgi:hypothetical protein